MPRPSPQPSSESANRSASDGDMDFLNSTGYIPQVITDGPMDATQPDGATQPGPADVVPPELISQALGPTFEVVFHTIAVQRGAHWELQPFEKTALVTGWTPIVQHLLAKLGDGEQVMLALAMTSTAAIVGGKVFQDASKQASSKASTKTQGSVVSIASSGNGAAGNQPAHGNSSGVPFE